MSKPKKSKKSKKNLRQIERMLQENDEIALFRIGEEEAKNRIDVLGIHKVHSTKMVPLNWGTTPEVKVQRVHKHQADISSDVWKKYLAKEITFAELKASGRVR